MWFKKGQTDDSAAIDVYIFKNNLKYRTRPIMRGGVFFGREKDEIA
jgi:hypothetical protein